MRLHSLTASLAAAAVLRGAVPLGVAAQSQAAQGENATTSDLGAQDSPPEDWWWDDYCTLDGCDDEQKTQLQHRLQVKWGGPDPLRQLRGDGCHRRRRQVHVLSARNYRGANERRQCGLRNTMESGRPA